ncbi:MAG TPA: YbhB/YbcL family Raf kinase inhibitor-like protein [Acidimicrobiales bacterium]|nr:YbhB/YbcL family Raf kinase inhibitor-like protein [Acidimicrobiales bacterium]
MSTRGLLVALALATSGVAACGDDGRALAPAPSTTTSTAPAATTSELTTMRLASVEIAEGATIDPRLTCDGANEPPRLVITGAPPSAAELAVAMVDLDAEGYVHWVVSGLPAGTDVIDPASLPDAATVARASSGVIGWDGPCPPPDDPPHRYELRAYALPEPSGIVAGEDGTEAVATLEALAIERATLTATYR